ncbi:MAG: hypothetical protein J2P36_14310, partial [Ktedonobacteraceae bacterium]|nr:hypothetical protein [Ktedonobacteraceae bacterium]
RFLSVIVGCLLISFVAFIPGCLALPNRFVTFADLGMMPFCVIALILNRAKKPTMAGILLTVAFEAALVMVILTSIPFDEPSLQQYELFVFGELLAVSLITPSSVFGVAVFNIAFITWSLLYQEPKLPSLTYYLWGNPALHIQAQFAPIWVRPIAVQFLVAGVTFLWVRGATNAIARANKAELIAKLEHEITEQKQGLEEGIRQILQTHVEVANGNLNARAPLTQDNVLWQIARALNTLLVRLQRATQAQRELQRVEQAVSRTVQAVQQAEQMNQKPRLAFTQTEIDPLIVALQGQTIDYAPPSIVQRSPNASPGMQPDMNAFPAYRTRQQ